MDNSSQRRAWGRAAGLLFILLLHAAVLYGLSSYQVMSATRETPPVFGYLIAAPVAPPQAAAPQTVPPVKLEKPRPSKRPQRQQLVTNAPVRSPVEAVAPPPPASPSQTPAVAAHTAPPTSTAEPLLLGNELAVSCPERTAPTYPALSMRRGEEGRVVLRVDLDAQGRVSRANVSSSSGSSRLDEAALAVVKTWRCDPARRAGQPVAAVAMQPFNFVLGGH